MEGRKGEKNYEVIHSNCLNFPNGYCFLDPVINGALRDVTLSVLDAGWKGIGYLFHRFFSTRSCGSSVSDSKRAKRDEIIVAEVLRGQEFPMLNQFYVYEYLHLIIGGQ